MSAASHDCWRLVPCSFACCAARLSQQQQLRQCATGPPSCAALVELQGVCVVCVRVGRVWLGGKAAVSWGELCVRACAAAAAATAQAWQLAVAGSPAALGGDDRPDSRTLRLFTLNCIARVCVALKRFDMVPRWRQCAPLDMRAIVQLTSGPDGECKPQGSRNTSTRTCTLRLV